MKRNLTIYFICLLCFTACKKQDNWLDVKSNKADIVPTTINEFQALLDNDRIMNTSFPAIGLVGSDNGYVSEVQASTSGSVVERNAYLWKSDIYQESTTIVDWSNPYTMIEYANIVLEGLDKIIVTSSNLATWNNAKGSAYFYRAIGYYSLAQLYCKPYTASSAATDLGLPLKTSSDVNEKPERSTVQQTYDLMLDDLKKAETLLPQTPVFKTRPSVIAARALLAKVYLSMERYSDAKVYSDLVLAEKSTLVDLNSLSATATYPFPAFQGNNPEILFYAVTVSYSMLNISSMFVVPELYNSYSSNDLRRTLFFRTNTGGTFGFRGRYTGTSTTFCGLAINEILLIRAECLAREGKPNVAMTDLNRLLKSRWRKDSGGNSTYLDQSAATADEALIKILDERRKEIPFTGNARWEDLRRLNKDPRFAKTLSRTVAGQTYTLPPNDQRYVLPIPPTELRLNNLVQNPR